MADINRSCASASCRSTLEPARDRMMAKGMAMSSYACAYGCLYGNHRCVSQRLLYKIDTPVGALSVVSNTHNWIGPSRLGS